MASYGGYSLTLGDVTEGTHDVSAIDYGDAGGVDVLLRPGTTLGMALAGAEAA